MTIASASNAVGLAINGRSADGLGAAYWFAKHLPLNLGLVQPQQVLFKHFTLTAQNAFAFFHLAASPSTATPLRQMRWMTMRKGLGRLYH
jgi:hypothetical protein